MNVTCLGGGPGGLFFASLLKQADPRHDVTVLERNQPDDTFGFGVVFSDATEEALAKADPLITEAMGRHAHRWDDIEIHYRGETLVSTGHGFSGLSRRTLLTLLHERCRDAGVRLCFGHEVHDPERRRDADLVVAADGVHSVARERYRDVFMPHVDERPNRFVWLGTTRPFPAFTFYFKPDVYGLWRVHAYQYEPGASTFIVEATEATWRAAGLDRADEATTIHYCESLFADELQGHPLISNRSVWRRFPTVRNARWHHGNVVLLGDAAHTAHFSIGSGTKLAMEDAIALAWAFRDTDDVQAATAAYEAERKPIVESTQRAAQGSLEWFEGIGRYMGQEPRIFAFNLLTRSRRITYTELQLRDPGFIASVDAVFDGRPPMFTPYRLRGLELANRVVVSPMDMYSAVDGTPGDFHLVHLGARGIGGAGLVMTEMICVSADGRITPGCGGLYRDDHTAAWRRIVDFVHANGQARIGCQLGHSGRKGSTKLMWEAEDEPLDEGNWPLLAPSPLPYQPGINQVPREMTRADMDAVRDDFVAATRRAADAGFDLLEVHMAHGYLLSSFLSPLTNVRTDEYGGSLENRARFPLEVFAACRAVWPEERPMSVRISAHDWCDEGFTDDDAVALARLLRRAGCDIVDVSSGQVSPDQAPAYGRSFQTPFADRIRHEAGIPAIAVGAISSSDDVNTIVLSGRADLCALARPHLHDPHWTLHAAADQEYDVEWIPQYRSGKRPPPTGKGDGIRRAPVRRFDAAPDDLDAPPARWRPRVSA